MSNEVGTILQLLLKSRCYFRATIIGKHMLVYIDLQVFKLQNELITTISVPITAALKYEQLLNIDLKIANTSFNTFLLNFYIVH